MPKKVNQTCNLESPDNRLGKYFGIRYYSTLRGASRQKKARVASSYNYETMKRHHF